MKPTKALTILAHLLKKPYFTSSEARDLGIHPATLSYYVKTGELKRVRRGLYQKANSHSSLFFQWEDLIEAIHSVKDGIVCLISALAIYELTEEIPRKHWIAIREGTSAKADRTTKIIRYRNMELGRNQINLEGIKIPIFDRERTIVDAFRLLSREVAIKALKSALSKRGKNRLDLVKLEEYAKRLRFNITPYLLSLTT
jgi:predicted transcriptional regulator of viral defense system